MSRITERDEHGNAQIVEYYNTKEATDKLAAYEDMGIPAVDTGVLTKALLKHRRAWRDGCQVDYVRECEKAIIEEMADVYIVLLQTIRLFGAQSLFEEYVNDKMLRLRLRLFAD